jgi:hypothetical protein
MQSKNLGEQETEVIGSFQKLMSLLWDINPQLLVYPWVNLVLIKPLKKGGKLPTNHDGLP